MHPHPACISNRCTCSRVCPPLFCDFYWHNIHYPQCVSASPRTHCGQTHSSTVRARPHGCHHTHARLAFNHSTHNAWLSTTLPAIIAQTQPCLCALAHSLIACNVRTRNRLRGFPPPAVVVMVVVDSAAGCERRLVPPPSSIDASHCMCTQMAHPTHPAALASL